MDLFMRDHGNKYLELRQILRTVDKVQTFCGDVISLYEQQIHLH